MFTVYMHINKINNKKYIGITSQEVNQRWRNGRGYVHGVFVKAIDKYGWENFEHIILADGLSEEKAIELEKYYIKKFKTHSNQFGYNVSHGGGGTLGVRLPEEVIDSYCKKVYQYDLKGNLVRVWKSGMEAERNGFSHVNISAVARGISKTHKGFIWSHKPIESFEFFNPFKSGKPIYQYDFNYDLIKKWKSIGHIVKAGYDRNNIYHCCNGDIHSSQGFIWSYKVIHSDKPFKRIRKDSQKVYQYDKNYNLIEDYDSISETEKFGFSKACVARCCKGERKTHKGFIWTTEEFQKKRA